MIAFRRIALVMLVALMGAGGFIGWRWLMQVPVRGVEVRGAVNAPPAEIIELAAIDTTLKLYDLERRLLEDRIRRHPWVAEASVTRLPTGLLSIRLLERAPVARALLSGGEPSYYMDRAGARMPAVDSIFHDVPLISGDLEPYHPVRPVEDQALLELLRVLPTLSPETDALVSEVSLRADGATLFASPAGEHPSMPVALGHSGYAEKLERLQAFWDAQILKRQDTRFAHIDLRFDSQIITREKTSGG